MTQLGAPLPPELTEIREEIASVLRSRAYQVLDADSVVTGKDFLLKIWELVISVPVGIALVQEDMSSQTIANIFYELGLMQAYGKETLVVKTPDAAVPSDFIRTEYVEHGPDFAKKLNRFMDGVQERGVYLRQMAGLLERNPLLAIDFPQALLPDFRG